MTQEAQMIVGAGVVLGGAALLLGLAFLIRRLAAREIEGDQALAFPKLNRILHVLSTAIPVLLLVVAWTRGGGICLTVTAVSWVILVALTFLTGSITRD